jgi:hypothetical protein
MILTNLRTTNSLSNWQSLQKVILSYLKIFVAVRDLDLTENAIPLFSNVFDILIFSLKNNGYSMIFKELLNCYLILLTLMILISKIDL